MGVELNNSDILGLLTSDKKIDKVGVAQDVGAHYTKELYSDEEIALAEEIFRLLMADAEVTVRATLSEALKLSNILPGDIAVTLAKDIEEVSIPMIEFSSILTDHDLIEIIREQSLIKAVAIARRDDISNTLRDELVSQNNESIVFALVSNDNFVINQEEGYLHTIIEGHTESEALLNKLIKKSTLPAAISEKLMSKVSHSIVDEVKKKYEISPDKLNHLATHTVEVSVLTLIDHSSTNHEIDSLVEHLSFSKNLTNSIILSSLCMGKRRFFICAIARKAGIPKSSAITLIKNGGRKGLSSLLRKAGMPEKLYEAIELILVLTNEKKQENKSVDVREFCVWLITKLEHISGRKNVEYLSYMMAIARQSQKPVEHEFYEI